VSKRRKHPEIPPGHGFNPQEPIPADTFWGRAPSTTGTATPALPSRNPRNTRLGLENVPYQRPLVIPPTS